jgi:hypothetical protein
MTHYCVTDEENTDFLRKLGELLKRWNAGGLDPSLTSPALQWVIEGSKALEVAFPAAASFAELVRVGKFDHVLNYVDAEFEGSPNWVGEPVVRGQFHLLDMGGDYRERDLPAALRAESKRLDMKVSLVTAYEGVYYALHGWNGHDTIAICGSSYMDSDGERRVAYLRGGQGDRKLGLGWSAYLWCARDLVLCVVE